MAAGSPIPPQLIERLQAKLGVSRAAVYRRIEKMVNTHHLERRPAALLLASRTGVNSARFSTPDDLAAIRDAVGTGATAPAPVKLSPLEAPTAPRPTHRRPKKGVRRPAKAQRGTTVWVVHGRNTEVAQSLRAFLRALGLQPVEWSQAVAKTKQGAPYVGEVLERAFSEAAAVVVLLTPDDEARLARAYRKASDPAHERELTGPARANVLFEAGMAFGKNANSTILVQLGTVRPFSDIAGRHVVHLDNTRERRHELAVRLSNAGCDVDLYGSDWLSAGDFTVGPSA